MNSPSKCAVLVPVGSKLEPECEVSLRALADRGYPVELLRGSSAIDLARSSMASHALQAGFDETLWVDADIQFNPDDVEKIRSHDLPLTVGLYLKKGKKEFAGKFLEGTDSVNCGVGGGLLEMRYVGMGFTHIRREVYERVEKTYGLPKCGGGYRPGQPIIPYFMPMIAPDGAGGMTYLPEDSAFCHRARDCGFKVMADTTIRVGHIGQKIYTWDDLMAEQNYDSITAKISHVKIAS